MKNVLEKETITKNEVDIKIDNLVVKVARLIYSGRNFNDIEY